MSSPPRNSEPHPITDILSILRRQGQLPGESEPARRIESLPPEEQEAALVAGKIVSEEDIAQAVASDAGLPYRAIQATEISPEVVTGVLPAPYARRNAMCALSREGDTLTVAVANPYRRSAVVDLERYLGLRVRVVVATRSDISSINGSLYNLRTSLVAAATELEDESSGDSDASSEFLSGADQTSDLAPTTRPVISALDSILRQAFEQRASDIHMEPKREHALVRFRVDGVLHDMHRFPRIVYLAVVSRLKMLSGLDIAEKRRPQDGRFKRIEPEKEIELRVSTMPTVFGEKAVLRVFDPSALVSSLDQMLLAPDERALLDQILGRREGLVLVTGPTGSGKTTTLYSVLRYLATNEVNVISIEDPVELVHPQLTQVQVNPRIGLDFAAAIRSVLRQDPDIVMVGEVRDGETAEMAVQAALTGHLVLSTLHTNDAASTVTRLSDLGVPPFLVASTLIGVVAQRLVRTICERCARETGIGPEEARRLGNPKLIGRMVQEGAGCARCRQSGYRGRRGVFEILPVEEDTREAIAARATAAEITRAARRRGLPGLRDAAVRLLLGGATSVAEVFRVTGVEDRSVAGGATDEKDPRRDDVEGTEHVRDGEDAAADGEPRQPPRTRERNPTDGRKRVHDRDGDQVEEQVDDRDLESPVSVRAGDGERSEEGGEGRADVRPERDRKGILEQQQAGTGERHHRRSGDRTGLNEHGDGRPDPHRENSAPAEHPVDGFARSGAREPLERAHQQHEAENQQGRRKEGEKARRPGTGPGELSGDPGEECGNESDDIPDGVGKRCARANQVSESTGDSRGQPSEETREDFEGKQDEHRQQVEHVVASGHLEGPAHGIGIGDVGERDQGVGDGGSHIRAHHHRNRTLERQRGFGSGHEGHDESARDRRTLDQGRGEDSGQESGDGVLESREEGIEQTATQTLESLAKPVYAPEEEQEKTRHRKSTKPVPPPGGGNPGHQGDIQQGDSQVTERNSITPDAAPGPPIFRFEE